MKSEIYRWIKIEIDVINILQVTNYKYIWGFIK